MAWLVDFRLDPGYTPRIRLPPENGRFFADAYWQMKYASFAYDPTLAPTRVLFGGGNKTIPDLTPIEGRFGVCQEVRDLIEELEPGVHQLLPVQVVRPRSTRPINRRDG